VRIGCHISIKSGYLGAAKTAAALGAQAFQYFPKNPRSLKIKRFDRTDAERCAAYCQAHGLVSIAHSAYASNLAASGTERHAVIASILNDLAIAEACGSIGTVVHFASFSGGDPLEGYKRMIDALNRILSQWQGRSLLLIENNAGQGGQMGTTLEELVKIRNLTDAPEKIGFCLDTCHAYAAGLWDGKNWDALVTRGKQLGYFSALKAVHLNNSVFPFGSRRDRHADVLKGRIAKEDMMAFMTSDVLREVPLILETPSAETELANLRMLVKE
jgi:deoxyribonuclease-4